MRKRNIHIQFWLDKKETEAFQKKVKKSGLSREAYLRHLVNGLEPQDAPPPDYYAMMRELHGIGNNLNQIAAKAHTLNALDVQRYDENCRKLDEAVKTITAAVILPRPMKSSGSPRNLFRGKRNIHEAVRLLTLAAKAISGVQCDVATTSIWRVKGWLGKVVIYAENPEKTANPKFYADRELAEHDGQQLSDVIRYAVNSKKTQETDSEDGAPLHCFVSGINCSPATARDEMLAVKKRFGKEDGTVAYHGYQSFAPGEATPELAHEIGVKLATRLWGDRYQVIVATHLDKENHLHNHFVVNTVSLADGIKYHRTRKDYHEMQTVSDELCREYGLSVIEHPQQGRGKQYGEWRAEQEQRPTWRGLIRTDIDEAIRQSMTERQFFDALRKKGYAVKVGKDISVRPPGKERFVRLMRNFGEAYSLDNIRRRILSQSRLERKKPEQKPEILRVRLIGSLKTSRKLTGFRALYIHYCYLLGIFPKSRPQQSRKRLHFLLREDLLKLDAITAETKLLIGHRIDTAEQLFRYRDEVSGKITALTEQRKQIYKAQRTAAVKSDPEKAAEVKAQITALSKELAALRKEVVLCNSIAERSGVIQEKIKAVHEDEQIKGKEKCDRTEQQKTVR